MLSHSHSRLRLHSNVMTIYHKTILFVALVMIVLSFYYWRNIDLDHGEAAQLHGVLGICENIPDFLDHDFEGRPRDFAFGARPFWNDSGNIDSIVVVMDHGRCTSSSCLAHFFQTRAGGRQCQYRFSSHLEKDTPLATSVVGPSSRDKLSPTNFERCQVIFLGFCY